MATPNMATLEKMPILVMRQILKGCYYNEIQVLRKVCRTLRFSIDQIKLDISEVHLKMMSSESVTFQIQGTSIKYEKHENGCLVTCDYNEIFYSNTHFWIVFLRDFKVFWNFLSEIHFFRIMFCRENNRLQELLENYLNSRPNFKKLKVQHLELVDGDDDQILSILPYIDPDSIDQLSITDVDQRESALKLEEIVELNQWKQAKKLKILSITVAEEMKHFLHFRDLNVDSLENLTTEDLVMIKNAFFSSSAPEIYTIQFKNFTENEDLLISEFGRHNILNWVVENAEVKQWILRIPGAGTKLLHIMLDSVFVEFKKMERKHIPEQYLKIFKL